MGIDSPGHHELPGGIDDPGSRSRSEPGSDLGDELTGDPNVGLSDPVGVHHPAPLDQDLGRSLPSSVGGSREVRGGGSLAADRGPRAERTSRSPQPACS